MRHLQHKVHRNLVGNKHQPHMLRRYAQPHRRKQPSVKVSTDDEHANGTHTLHQCSGIRSTNEMDGAATCVTRRSTEMQ
jgi:hypothetical protein